MAIQYSVIIAYALGIVLLYVLGRVLLVPMKVILKFVYNSVLGAIALIAINFIGGFFHFNIALNFVSAIIAGILGIPGIILLIALKLIFKA